MKLFSLSLLFFTALFCFANEKQTSLKGLLVTGGGHHDYATQKNIITQEISKRISVEWEILFEMDPRRMKGLLGREDWAKGYDFIFYNFCFAREDDTEFIDKVVAVHQGGVPAIAMHCAMHTYCLLPLQRFYRCISFQQWPGKTSTMVFQPESQT